MLGFHPISAAPLSALRRRVVSGGSGSRRIYAMLAQLAYNKREEERQKLLSKEKRVHVVDARLAAEAEKFKTLQAKIDNLGQFGLEELEEAYKVLSDSLALQEHLLKLQAKIRRSIDNQAVRIEKKRQEQIDEEDLLIIMGVI